MDENRPDHFLAWNLCMAIGDLKGARKAARLVYPDTWFPCLRLIWENRKEIPDDDPRLQDQAAQHSL